MNSYWMFWIGALSRRFSASCFCDFRKITLWFHRIFSFLTNCIPFIFQMCFMRRIVAYLCQNMINFDAADFNERRSEEVMFHLTLGVYLSEIKILHLFYSLYLCTNERLHNVMHYFPSCKNKKYCILKIYYYFLCCKLQVCFLPIGLTSISIQTLNSVLMCTTCVIVVSATMYFEFKIVVLISCEHVYLLLVCTKFRCTSGLLKE